jgi:hypothetical protein
MSGLRASAYYKPVFILTPNVILRRVLCAEEPALSEVEGTYATLLWLVILSED